MTPLKLFAIVSRGSFGGGMAIVAAPNEETARRFARIIVDSNWGTRYDAPHTITELPGEYVGAMGVLTHFETGE